jgi:hypothetical protein
VHCRSWGRWDLCNCALFCCCQCLSAALACPSFSASVSRFCATTPAGRPSLRFPAQDRETFRSAGTPLTAPGTTVTFVCTTPPSISNPAGRLPPLLARAHPSTRLRYVSFSTVSRESHSRQGPPTARQAGPTSRPLL